MRTLFILAMLGGFFYSLYWFISFQKDPYNLCQEHPNKKLRAEYYLCQPGDFDFPKGIFEKTVPTPWMKTKNEKAYLNKENNKKKNSELQKIDPEEYSE